MGFYLCRHVGANHVVRQKFTFEDGRPQRNLHAKENSNVIRNGWKQLSEEMELKLSEVTDKFDDFGSAKLDLKLMSSENPK